MKRFKRDDIIKVVLAIVLLLCLLPMPYGFYNFVRFGATIGFAYFAYDYWRNGAKRLAFVFSVLVLLFQPLAKIALGRELWNIVDVCVAILLIVTMSIWHRNSES